MTPEEQEAELRARLADGWAWIDELLNDPCRRRVVERLAESRHRKGFETFGDSGWQKHSDALMQEMLEELADFLVYAAMRSYRRRGGPGV